MNTFKKDAEWLAVQPKKQVVAKLIIKSEKGNVLLVNPTYVDYWQLPGGGVEEGEDPKATAVREVSEELGINVKAKNLKIVDTIYKKDEEAIILIYELQTLLDEDTQFVLPPDELKSCEFVTMKDAGSRLGSHMGEFWSRYNS